MKRNRSKKIILLLFSLSVFFSVMFGTWFLWPTRAEGYGNIQTNLQTNSSIIHVVNQTSPACTTGDCYHSTIQDAVDHASSGDEIIVCPGTYNEWVDVFKSLTVRSYSGNPADTIVNCSGSGDYAGFEVDADYVNISGFTVTGFTGDTYGHPNSGILLVETKHANISNNILKENKIGIWFYGSNYSIVEKNIVRNNEEYGIWLYGTWYSFPSGNPSGGSYNNIIRFNNISSSSRGISLGEDYPYTEALDNTIEYNNIVDPDWMNFFNGQASNVTAEHNWWSSSNFTTIDNKIYDDDENPSYGEVDFIPFLYAPYPGASVCVTTKPNNQQGILYMVNVTVFNGSNVIASGISNISGMVTFTNLPYGNLTFVAYARSDYSQVIGNVTVSISSPNQSFDLICDQNYSDVSNNWEIAILALSMSMLIIALPLLLFSSRIRIKKYGKGT